MTPPLKHLTPSSQNLFLECPHHFEHKYIKRTPVPKTDTPQKWREGTAVHETVEAIYTAHKQQKACGKVVENPFFHEVLDSSAVQSIKKNALIGGEETFTAITTMATAAVKNDAIDHTDILGIEHWFKGVTPNGTPFLGSADLITRIDATTIRLRDYKTRNKITSHNELFNDNQQNLYGAFIRINWPWVETVISEFVYPNFDGEQVEIEQSPEKQGMVLAQFDATWQMIQNTQTFQPREHDNCGFCPHQKVCPIFEPDRQKQLFDDMLKI